jgi:hypothetical protein
MKLRIKNTLFGIAPLALMLWSLGAAVKAR